MGGSVETAIALGVGNAVVDLVESGETMRAAGLKPIGTVMSTSATLIGSPATATATATATTTYDAYKAHKDTLQLVKDRISGVLAADKFVVCNYNAPRHALQKLLLITPGRRAPTITALYDEEGTVAVSSMVEKNSAAEVMDRLSANKASDIILFQVSNCR